MFKTAINKSVHIHMRKYGGTDIFQNIRFLVRIYFLRQYADSSSLNGYLWIVVYIPL